MTKVLLWALAVATITTSVSAQTPAPQPAPASPPPEYPIVRVGVLSYLQYLTELENRDGYNSFDMTRAYLNINGQLADRVRFRFAPDIRRVTDGSLAGSLTVRVKYGFLQLDNVLTRGSWVRFGLAQTPWLDFEESVNRSRVQGTMFSEREGLIPGSADFGAGYLSPLPNNFGEFHFGVYNGVRSQRRPYRQFAQARDRWHRVLAGVESRAPGTRRDERAGQLRPCRRKG